MSIELVLIIYFELGRKEQGVIETASWYLNTMQNTWEPFEKSLNAFLEEKFCSGEKFGFISIDKEKFMFRLDKMAMFHCDTSYMIRLRRRKDDKFDSLPKVLAFDSSENNPKDEHFLRVVASWTEHQKTLLRELSLIFPDTSLQHCGHALLKAVTFFLNLRSHL